MSSLQHSPATFGNHHGTLFCCESSEVCPVSRTSHAIRFSLYFRHRQHHGFDAPEIATITLNDRNPQPQNIEIDNTEAAIIEAAIIENPKRETRTKSMKSMKTEIINYIRAGYPGL